MSNEPHVYGSARVAYRHNGKYYFDKDFIGGPHQYRNTLSGLFKRIPSDAHAFSAWKDSEIARLKMICASTSEDNGAAAHAKLQESFSLWTRPRPSLVRFPEVHDVPYALERPMQDQQHWNAWPLYIVELDFDNMCVLLQGHPILKLQPDMPGWSLIYKLHATRRTNSYGHPFSLGHAIPEKYRFDVFHDVPHRPVDKPALLSYFRHNPTLAESDKLLGVSPTMSTSELASVAYRSNLLGIYLFQYGTDVLRHIVLAGEHRNLVPQEKSLALALVATVLTPSHALSPAHIRLGTDPERTSEDGVTSWWARKHICVTLARDLHVERNRHAAMGHLIDNILRSNSAPAVVFGVAFSVLHCVMVRVCTDATGAVSVAHTAVLDFMPDLCGTCCLTQGIQAVGRLGYLSADDDVWFFHSILCSMPYAIRETAESLQAKQQIASSAAESELPQQVGDQDDQGAQDHNEAVMSTPVLSVVSSTLNSQSGNTILNIPVELVLYIAFYLYHPRDLNALAVTCTKLMAACLPLIRLPQVLDIDGAAAAEEESRRRYATAPPGFEPDEASNDDRNRQCTPPEPTGFILMASRDVHIASDGDSRPDIYAREFKTAHPGYEDCDVSLMLSPFDSLETCWSHERIPKGPNVPCLRGKGTMTMRPLAKDWVNTREWSTSDPDDADPPVAEFDAWFWRRRE